MKKTLAVLLSCSMIFGLSACGSSGTASTTAAADTGATEAAAESKTADAGATTKPGSPVDISFGTASVGGNYYVLGSGIAAIWNEKIPEYVTVTPQATGGSGANVGLVQSGECNVAMTVENTFYNGLNGLGWANGEKYDNIRAMVVMMPSAWEMVATKQSGITSIEQLPNATVCIGPATSGGNLAFLEFQEATGLKYKAKVDLSWSDCTSQMSDGIIDVMTDFGTFPHSARTELVTNNECVWVDIPEDYINKICEKYAYYYPGIEPAGTYKYMDKDYPTVLCNNIMFCSADLDDETVYQMTKCVYENLDEWKLSSTAVDYITLEAVNTISVPLHPGAIRYFEEVGIELPESAYPADYQK